MKLILGDCLEKLKELEDNSVDSVVTDPPYGWRFMGKAWDAPDIQKTLDRDKTLPDDDKTTLGMAVGKYDNSLTANQSFQKWTESWAREVFRVLKPGGHALIFCGPRTYHRMASGVEDAGFEIRDQIQWLFGSGFPKSHDVSKAIDKHFGAEREVVGKKSTYRKPQSPNGWDCNKREEFETTPATDLAKQWQGLGSALKPANEPIVLARKPLEKGLTIAENVMKWNCGGINIDDCRIGFDATKEGIGMRAFSKQSGLQVSDQVGQEFLSAANNKNKQNALAKESLERTQTQGRWPANLILSCTCGKKDKHDETCVVDMLDEQSGILSSGHNPKIGNKCFFGNAGNYKGNDFKYKPGGASRFFYCAKSSKSERNAGLEGITNGHPTVKPIKLMEYLIKLITPPKGTCLDPFMGSGSTGIAAKKLGFDFIGIEREDEYMKIAEARINNVMTQLELEEEQ